MEPQSSNTSPILPSYGSSSPPPKADEDKEDASPPVDLIRQKIDSLFIEAHEPDVQEEAAIAQQPDKPPSKHQQFMKKLSASGKPLAEIQTAWHNYYLGLPDKEKHEIWEEFYVAHALNSRYAKAQAQTQLPKVTTAGHRQEPEEKKELKPDLRKKRVPTQTKSVAEIRQAIVDKVNTRQKLKPKQHFQSLIFGLGMGSLVILILLFSFFNERIIAPFISPSRHVSSTPIIADSTTAVSANPEVIIPKINVEIPVDYSQTSIDEAAVDKSL